MERQPFDNSDYNIWRQDHHLNYEDGDDGIRKSAFEGGYDLGLTRGFKYIAPLAAVTGLLGGIVLCLSLSSCSNSHKGLEKDVQTPAAVEQVEGTNPGPVERSQ